MSLLQRVVIVALSLSILALTVEFIRRKKLLEEYSLLWILASVMIMVFAMVPKFLYSISNLLGLHHLTTMLFIAFLFLLGIVLHFSIIISQHTERETKLAQRLAIVSWRLDAMERTNSGNDSKEEDAC